LTNHAIEEGYADKNNLLIAGWSQGGFLSFIASVRNGMHGKGWKFKAAIPGAGVAEADTMILTSDIGDVQANLAGKPMWKCDKSDTSNRTGSALWEFKKAAEEGVIPPMLILHGEVCKSMGRKATRNTWVPRGVLLRPRCLSSHSLTSI
jgi:dipeptidyl aminopeptidase/acylaminoacyl peptidase